MLPKKGRVFPHSKGANAVAIAQALQHGLGDTHRAIKIAMRWTGASERTVKNWFAGVDGPSGQHLIALVRNSDEVLDIFLLLAEREQTITAKKLVNARNKLAEVLTLIQALLEDDATISTP